jgi:CBS domain-containing protein
MRPEEPVSRIMTEAVVVIDRDRPLSEAFDCFRQYAIHHLPVVRAGRLVGMLSSTDLTKVEYFAPRGAVDRAAFLDSKFLIIVSGNHAVTIVDGDERVLGIVTTTDIMRALLHGPPRRGSPPPAQPQGQALPEDEASAERNYRRKPTPDQYAAALRAADALYVQGHDPNAVAKTLLYLDERRAYLEKVLVLADRYLTAGQDEHNHALLLKAVLAAKRAEEHAAVESGVPFPLQ